MMILLAWLTLNQATPDFYVCKNAKVNLFSSAPVEDIAATSTRATSVFNATTGELAFKIPINSFVFPKGLMEEHFNSEYMESDKYPVATFNGRVQERIDISKDGVWPVTVTGDLTVHGVTKPRTVTGKLTVKNGALSMESEFMVRCADHNIKIPQIVFHNIAETIKINVWANYRVYKK